jgi:uncharacterized protein (DUF4415 family)
MKTQLTSPKRKGRPPTDGPIKRPFNVMLDPRVAEGLRAYGDDNLSIGVALAAAKAAERAGMGGALPDVRTAMSGAPSKPRAKTKTKGKGKTKTKAAADASGRGVGRPVVGIAPRIRTNLHLYPAVVEQLRIFGDGVVAQGIERAAILVRAVRL